MLTLLSHNGRDYFDPLQWLIVIVWLSIIAAAYLSKAIGSLLLLVPALATLIRSRKRLTTRVVVGPNSEALYREAADPSEHRETIEGAPPWPLVGILVAAAAGGELWYHIDVWQGMSATGADASNWHSLWLCTAANVVAIGLSILGVVARLDARDRVFREERSRRA